MLSFELVPEASADAKLSAPVDLEGEQLIRLDTVSFPPGGVAYLHVHRGPGIRVLLDGAIRIDTEGTTTAYGPLEAWFESGSRAGVRGGLGDDADGVRALHGAAGRAAGKRSLRYVRDEDADKPKLQEYRIFVDELLSDAAVAT